MNYDLRKAWDSYRKNALVRRAKKQREVMRDWTIIEKHLTIQELMTLSTRYAQALFSKDGRPGFEAICDEIEKRLFEED